MSAAANGDKTVFSKPGLSGGDIRSLPRTYKQESFRMERGVDAMESVSFNESKLRTGAVLATVAMG